MLPLYFGTLCDLVNALADLDAAMPPSRHQYALHALVHRFDEALDLIVEASFLETPAMNNYEGHAGHEEKRMTTIETIAKVCHQANKAWCESLDDRSQVDWEQAPDWQRASATTGVQFVLAHPEAPESAQHEAWWKDKQRDGWVYGPVKDEAAKTHPCCVPYADLPVAQRRKDALFQAIVRALTQEAL